MNLTEELNTITELAIESGKKIMEVYNSDNFNITKKDDDTPLTKADLLANEIIVSGLRKKFHGCSILTEEEKDNKERLNNDYVWIIDPLDGTKEFISGNGEFTVNIALSYKGEPVLGVIHIPVDEELFFASKDNGTYYQKGGDARRIRVSGRSDIRNMILVKSRSHADEKIMNLTNKYEFAEVKPSGSSLKGCLIARGYADIYFRFGPVNEWDVCAMDIIVRESGGIMTDLEGKPLNYNRKDTLIKGFLVSNNKIHDKLLNLQRSTRNQKKF